MDSNMDYNTMLISAIYMSNMSKNTILGLDLDIRSKHTYK